MGLSGPAHAVPRYLNDFNAKYGTTQLSQCILCHTTNNPDLNPALNPYGAAFNNVGSHGANPTGAFTTIEPADSATASQTLPRSPT
jgi:hypothetical protein